MREDGSELTRFTLGHLSCQSWVWQMPATRPGRSWRTPAKGIATQGPGDPRSSHKAQAADALNTFAAVAAEFMRDYDHGKQAAHRRTSCQRIIDKDLLPDLGRPAGAARSLRSDVKALLRAQGGRWHRSPANRLDKSLISQIFRLVSIGRSGSRSRASAPPPAWKAKRLRPSARRAPDRRTRFASLVARIRQQTGLSLRRCDAIFVGHRPAAWRGGRFEMVGY